jgi:hypothetical protein
MLEGGTCTVYSISLGSTSRIQIYCLRCRHITIKTVYTTRGRYQPSIQMVPGSISTTTNKQIYIVRGITLCSPVNVNRRFRTKYRLDLRGRSVCQVSNLCEWGCFLAWLTLQPWRLRRYVLPKLPLTFIALQGDISQKQWMWKPQIQRLQ